MPIDGRFTSWTKTRTIGLPSACLTKSRSLPASSSKTPRTLNGGSFSPDLRAGEDLVLGEGRPDHD